MREQTCANHPLEPAAVSCASCGRRLCAACWRRNVDDRPWCELCIHHVTSSGSNLPVAITFALLSGSFAAVGWRWEATHSHHHLVFWSCFVIASVAATLLAAMLARAPEPRRVELRSDSNARPPIVTASARRYRAIAFRASRAVASPVSGRWTAVVVMVSMLSVSIALPELLHLPRWLEVESVIAGWWAIWATALSVLLYRGWRVSHDHVLAPPRAPWRVQAHGRVSDAAVGAGRGCNSGCDPGFDLEGCGEAIVGVLFAIALLAAAWLIVEMVAPALFFFAYFLVRNSLARVANDEHGCEADLLRAGGWGAQWATLYCAPIAVAVVALHAYLMVR